jgi:hypothetical protein
VVSAHWERNEAETPLSREFRDPASIVLDLAAATNWARRTRLRNFIKSRPPEEVVPLLAHELNECSEAKRFARVANTIADLESPDAFEALARHARTQRRFPGLAIRALAKCGDPRVTPLLMDLVEYGRRAQQMSALGALGRSPEILSTVLLCRIAADRSNRLRQLAIIALRRKGGASGISQEILLSGDLDLAEKVRYLLALETAPVQWSGFRAERRLERIVRTPLHPLAPEARAALDLLRAQGTLLRAAVNAPDHALLRPSRRQADSDSERLLRPSDSGEEDSDAAPGIRSLLTAVHRRFRQVFQRTC